MARKKSSKRKAKRLPIAPPVSSAAPRSWELRTWPAQIWPHATRRAQWISRCYRKELLAAGAMTRVGKMLVFIGLQYEAWLEHRVNQVVEDQSNNPALNKGIQAPQPEA